MLTAPTLTIRHGDSAEVLKAYPAASIDACVTDPPYGLNFMGKAWDYDVPQAALWREVQRVLKPGAHLVAFFGARTYHRGVVQIEDAGFEIRDMTAWLYGSGFPKSLDVSKAIDKAAGAERQVVGRKSGRAASPISDLRGARLIGSSDRAFDASAITAPATAAAKAWEGWGTAQKPALEPICLARKPLNGTVAANVLAHGTGALNIDGCRVGVRETPRITDPKRTSNTYGSIDSPGGKLLPDARWPANVIHDGSDEVVGAFPEQSSGGYPPAGGQRTRGATYGKPNERGEAVFGSSSGSAARFFYSAKADATDRLGSEHATVKPVDLMAWLCRLVTPPGGTVLDPFAGSGTTGIAALSEGFSALLIEREAEHVADCERRLANWRGEISARDAVMQRKLKAVSLAKRKGEDTPLFGGAR